ncbi:MAG TPA: GcrA family cell cycle regulator, partial [Paracoccus sp. (in: a-proteobacteria)]|nr:GcrA family cell cycle regulator [Paracoccus sp. (in: a-proteobacteria)]
MQPRPAPPRRGAADVLDRSEGQSASQIAKELGGVTRNAVIGKVHRLGLSNRIEGEEAPALSATPEPVAETPAAPAVADPVPRTAPEPDPGPARPAEAGPVDEDAAQASDVVEDVPATPPDVCAAAEAAARRPGHWPPYGRLA